MRKLVIASALLVILSKSAIAGSEEGAFQVLAQLTQAFKAFDVDRIVNLYAPDALFFGTGSQTLVTSTEAIRKYFEQVKTDMPRDAMIGDCSSMILSDTVVLFTGLDAVSRTKDGTTTGSNGRFTFVVAERDQGWRIVHCHRSAQRNYLDPRAQAGNDRFRAIWTATLTARSWPKPARQAL